jgi:hypothetical protein
MPIGSCKADTVWTRGREIMAAATRGVDCNVGLAEFETWQRWSAASGCTLPELLTTGMAPLQAASNVHAAGGQLILATGDGQSSERSHPRGPLRRASTPHRPPAYDTGAAPRGYCHGGLYHVARCKRISSWVGSIIHLPRLPVKAPQLSRHVDRRSRGWLAWPMAVSPAGPWGRERAMTRMVESQELFLTSEQRGGSGRGRSRPLGGGPGLAGATAGREGSGQHRLQRSGVSDERGDLKSGGGR